MWGEACSDKKHIQGLVPGKRDEKNQGQPRYGKLSTSGWGPVYWLIGCSSIQISLESTALVRSSITARHGKARRLFPAGEHHSQT